MILTIEGVNGNDEVYMDCLRAICGEASGKSMIDLFTNRAPHTPLLGFHDRVYVDINDRILDHPEEQRRFIQADVFELDLQEKFDVAICSDGIEHCTKENGFALLHKMELISEKQVLFTPLGEYMVDKESTDPEGHHSGWTPEDLDPEYACIVFPVYHPTLHVGAFFFFRSGNGLTTHEEYLRVKAILETKRWYPK